MRIILVADHASIDFGGEAALPCHYFRIFKQRGIDVHLVVHERSKSFLQKSFPNSGDLIHYVNDTKLHRAIHKFAKYLPDRVSHLTLGFLLRFVTQVAQKKLIKNLINDELNTVVHQVIPVSPKEPSIIAGLGVPVVFGPLNGGMAYPKAFSNYEGRFSSCLNSIGKPFSELVHYFLPGKRKAQVILVANDRTKAALPKLVKGRVETLVENGVDLSIWKSSVNKNLPTVPTFVYVGRLVDWKAVDLLLEAVGRIPDHLGEIELHVIGDGNERMRLEKLANEVPANRCNITFHGWLQQEEINIFLRNAWSLVLPSLFECGGAVILEAMASGTTVIATEWGGPADYLDNETGVLVKPSSKNALVSGITEAMVHLIERPELVKIRGLNARKKVEHLYDWEKKADEVYKVYLSLIGKAM